MLEGDIMFSFNKLWKLLIDLGMSKTEFRQKVGLSSTTVAAMGKGTGLTPKVLARIVKRCIANRVTSWNTFPVLRLPNRKTKQSKVANPAGALFAACPSGGV